MPLQPDTSQHSCELVKDLRRLRELRSAFNPFQILRVSHRESTHEQMLRWLLDPRENHGLGVQFLSNFLKLTGVTNARKFDATTCVQSEVPLDGGRVDLLLLNAEQKAAVVVELKTYAELNNPLRLYREAYSVGDYKDWDSKFIYLTPRGDPIPDAAETGHWTRASYSQIRCAIDTVTRKSQTDAARFARAYGEHLRRWFERAADSNVLSRHIMSAHDREMQQCPWLLEEFSDEIAALERVRRSDAGVVEERLSELVRCATAAGGLRRRNLGQPADLSFSPDNWPERSAGGPTLRMKICAHSYHGIAVEIRSNARRDVAWEEKLRRLGDYHWERNGGELSHREWLMDGDAVISALNSATLSAVLVEHWEYFAQGRLPIIERDFAAIVDSARS